MNNTNDPFVGLNQPEPTAQYFYEDFFQYRHTEEFKREKKQGGIHKLLALIKALLF